MPKKTSKTDTAIATAPVAAPVQAESAGNVKKTKTQKTTKSEPSVAEVAQPPVVEQSAQVQGVAPETDAPITEQSVEFLAKLQHLSVVISNLKAEFKSIEKKWTREIKTAQKVSSKRKRKAGNRAPSGFVKPTKISDELAKFLGKEMGTELARTEVTRYITDYIRNNELQDKGNGRIIHPDAKLASLLKLDKNAELTYFNLQKYMSPHFAKASKVVKEATA